MSYLARRSPEPVERAKAAALCLPQCPFSIKKIETGKQKKLFKSDLN